VSERRLLKRLLPVLFLVLLPAVAAAAGPGKAKDRAPVPVGKEERCPVCGMFVAKFPDFMALVRFKDGRRAVFDGAKDMFKFLFDLNGYFPGTKASDITGIQVTDYYGLVATDGRAAYYVIGSDVYGPMGKELVPFETEADAREFLKDHGGTAVLRFRDVTPAVLRPLDE